MMRPLIRRTKLGKNKKPSQVYHLLGLHSQAPLLGLEPRTYPDPSGSAALTNSGAKLQTSGGTPDTHYNHSPQYNLIFSTQPFPILGHSGSDYMAIAA